MHPIQESLMNPKGKYRLLSWRVQWKKQVIGWNCTQVPEVFFHCEERREERERERSSKRKPLIMVVLNLTSMHLTAVKYVTWVITLLTNHRGVITNSSNREQGPVSDPTVQHISQLTTITRGFLSLSSTQCVAHHIRKEQKRKLLQPGGPLLWTVW